MTRSEPADEVRYYLLSNLLYFLRARDVPHQALRNLRRLTTMRHLLAHLKPVPAEVLLDHASPNNSRVL